MKRRTRKIASLIAAATMSTAMATMMPLEASAATTYTYNDTYSTIKYQLTTVNGQARAEITKVTPKYVTNSAGNVFIYIPTTLSSRPVSIGQYAFQNINQPFEVSATDVREIKSYAFDSCQGLQEFYVSQNCTDIASRAFNYCHCLQRAIFQGSQYAVNNDSSLTIGTNAFYSCTSLNYISFGCRDDIIIKKQAFNGCQNLKNFTKDNASADHSSIYVQSQAFKGSGLENYTANNNAIVPASKVQSNIFWSNTGYGKKLVGNVLVCDLITQTPDTSYYEPTSPRYFSAGNCALLMREAQKYGVNLNIQNISAIVNTSMTCAQIDNVSTFLERPEVLSALKSTFSFLSSCTTIDQATSTLKSHYGCSEIAYVVDINADRRSYAWCGNYREYAVVYSSYTYGMNHNTVWMHEISHLFGAQDVYTGVAANPSYTNSYLRDDMMNCNLDNVGWFTASSIGWTDTALRPDVLAVQGDTALNAKKAAANGPIKLVNRNK